MNEYIKYIYLIHLPKYIKNKYARDATRIKVLANWYIHQRRANSIVTLRLRGE